jgi:hypothetical protein
MKVLSRMLNKTKEGGYIDGFRDGNDKGNELCISYFLFADDVL